MPYMTWARKNGDASNCASYPEMCSYQSMDSALKIQYLKLTGLIDGEVSPVSAVWNYLRQNYPGIELYQPDESHPSAAGSYAAACCFYAALFKKDPNLITYDFGLNPADAAIIRDVARRQVFDSLQLWDFKKLPLTNIQFQVGSGTNEIIFESVNLDVNQDCFWDFGDGDTSSSAHTVHSYLSDGTYTVTLTTTTCDLQGMHTSTADTVIQFCSHTPTVYTTHPWLCNYDTLWTQPADSYQWFYGVLLPETSQYVADYSRYGGGGFRVISTVNGCSELSAVFTESPEWSGYYFDGVGDPCAGDTVAFAVLNSNGPLSGLENIFWFKNDTLLPLMTNKDTLLISSAGKYECQVIVPASNCPLDTTYAVLEYDCDATAVVEIDGEIFFMLFPNPAFEIISVRFLKNLIPETIQIYDATGRLVRSVNTTESTTQIPIADLPMGLYYIRLQNHGQYALNFIRL
jgi:hypothetical protein